MKCFKLMLDIGGDVAMEVLGEGAGESLREDGFGNRLWEGVVQLFLKALVKFLAVGLNGFWQRGGLGTALGGLEVFGSKGVDGV